MKLQGAGDVQFSLSKVLNMTFIVVSEARLHKRSEIWSRDPGLLTARVNTKHKATVILINVLTLALFLLKCNLGDRPRKGTRMGMIL